MYARLLALFSLLCVSLLGARREPADRAVVDVYLNALSQPADPSVLEQMRREMKGVLGKAHIELRWAYSQSSLPKEGAAHLVVMELKGSCEGRPDELPSVLTQGLKLASSASADGRILPFTWLDCEALNRFLGSSAAEAKTPKHYGRAMGRLLAHELYHVLTDSEAHMASGITKPRLSVADLTADHLDFAPEAMAKLLSFSHEANAGAPAVEAGFDVLSGDGR